VLTRSLPERLTDHRLIISAMQIRLILAVWYDISLQNMSLTHNDNLS